MAKFDLEKHKAGRKARTRSGYSAEWVCSVNDGTEFSEVFKMTDKKGKQHIREYTISGHLYSDGEDGEGPESLELEPEKVTLYINVYRGSGEAFFTSGTFDSLEEAERYCQHCGGTYIKTAPIEIEI